MAALLADPWACTWSLEMVLLNDASSASPGTALFLCCLPKRFRSTWKRFQQPPQRVSVGTSHVSKSKLTPYWPRKYKANTINKHEIIFPFWLRTRGTFNPEQHEGETGRNTMHADWDCTVFSCSLLCESQMGKEWKLISLAFPYLPFMCLTSKRNSQPEAQRLWYKMCIERVQVQGELCGNKEIFKIKPR